MEEENQNGMSKKEANKYMRFLIKEWSTAENEASRLKAFLTLRKLLLRNEFLIEQTMKTMYLTFVKHVKQYSDINHNDFIMMRNYVTELYAMNIVSAYQHAFVYIRQLAILVRNAMTSMSKTDIQTVYNWQFMNCLRLWTYMATQPSLQEAFKPLIYPLIQVIDSTLNLIPTARYYPMRLHCVDLYIQITSVSSVFIPIAPLLLDVIENEKFMEKPGATTSKPPNINFCIKLSKTFLVSRAVQDTIVSRAVALLADYLCLLEKNVAYPELAFPVARSLKLYAKKCKVSQWSNASRALVQKLEKQIDSVLRAREAITGAPKELKEMKDQNVKK